MTVRQFAQKRNEPVQKFMPIFEYSSIEKWELKHNRSKLWAEDVNRSQEFLQFSIAVR
jgi:hypothetical protein